MNVKLCFYLKIIFNVVFSFIFSKFLHFFRNRYKNLEKSSTCDCFLCLAILKKFNYGNKLNKRCVGIAGLSVYYENLWIWDGSVLEQCEFKCTSLPTNSSYFTVKIFHRYEYYFVLIIQNKYIIWTRFEHVPL